MPNRLTNVDFQSFVLRAGGSAEGHAGPPPPIPPVFQANVPNQDTGFMDDVAIGIGGLTEARAGSLWVPDFEGIYQEFGPEEVARSGGRVTGDVGSRQVSWQYENGDPLPQLPRIVHVPEATNTFLNNYTPATQDIAGQSGDRTCWLEGTGSVTLSGGMAGIVTEGNPITGNPGGATVNCAVSGTPDFVMFEDNSAPTAPIPTGATAETRPACALSFDAANHGDAEGTYLIDVVLSGSSNILDGFLLVVNGLATLTDGGNTTVAPKLHPEKMGFVYGPDGLRVTADGVSSALVPYDGTLLSGELDLFRAAAVAQEAGEINRYSIADQLIIDAAMPAPPSYSGIVLAVKTTTENETFILPCFNAGVYNATIDWGDGTAVSTITTWNDADLVHAYSEPGVHEVTITGVLPRIYFNNTGDKDKVVGLLSAESVATAYSNSFYGCSLSVVPSQIINLTTTSFAYCFRENGLTSIPEGLFDNTPNVTNFSRCFFVNDLTSLPKGLFDNTPGVIDFSLCFYDNSLMSIPEGLFDNTPNVIDINSCFRDNDLVSIPEGLFDNTPGIKNFSYCFYGNDLTSVPGGLFANTPDVTDFSFCFRGNSLVSIPEGLFDNTPDVTSFSYCFFENALTSIPAELFDNTPDVIDFSYCFYANSLTSIPAGLFDNTPNVTNFRFCFYGHSLTSVPEGLFDFCTVATDFTNCFLFCNLTQQSTDNVLVSLDTAGALNGTLDIGGAQPSAAGQAAKANLEGKGWTVTVTTP